MVAVTPAVQPAAETPGSPRVPGREAVRMSVHRDGTATSLEPLPDPELAARATAPRLRASWRRSQQYGVSPDEVDPAFTGSVDKGSLLYECASQVLTGLQSTIAGEPLSLMVADRDGLVLARLCSDSAILRSLDQVHLAPGFYYDERHAGTNGLGLSLADRAPSLVRAADHYCTELRGYTCAAVPVMDPSGNLAGSINLTTWSTSSSDLLLGLAQAAAGATSALMLARSAGRSMPPPPRGKVFHVVGGPPDGGTVVVGEAGAGKSALAALARRRGSPRQRILLARTPGAADVDAWLELWTPGLRSADPCIIVSGIHRLPAWAAEELAQILAAVRRSDGRPQPFVLTAPGSPRSPARCQRWSTPWSRFPRSGTGPTTSFPWRTTSPGPSGTARSQSPRGRPARSPATTGRRTSGSSSASSGTRRRGPTSSTSTTWPRRCSTEDGDR
jgi:sigma-54 dependent transcriptional regulator, acetoin dehydrogenase operon transcriptional activator AcoR